MPIYRGDGGSGDSSTDAYASQIATYAQTATTKANEAADSATAASGSESDANDSAVDALAAKVAAETAQGFAEAAQVAAEAAYDNFDDRYLGAKASDPSVDNDGNPLLTGALYFNSTSSQMKVYSGSVWQILSGQGTVTSVAGTGTVNGITLTGTVTESGSLTLGGTLSGISSSQLASQNVSQFTNDSAYLTTVAFADVTSKPTTLSGYGITDAATSAQGTLADSALQTGDNVSTLVNDSGYITSYTETDTLDSVTNRGATTTNAVTVGGLTSTGNVTASNLNTSDWNTAYGWGDHASAGYYVNGDSGFASTGIDDNATSTAITIDASENVGIGVSGALTNTLNFPNAASIGFKDTGGNFRNSLQFNASNELQIGAAGAGIPAITLGPNGSEWVTVKSSGNVGIGETSPSSLLHLKGMRPELTLEDTESFFSPNRVSFRNSAGTYPAEIGNNPNINGDQRFMMGTLSGYPLGLMTNAALRMTIDATGNVGIGTDSPTEKLTVRGDVTLAPNSSSAADRLASLTVGKRDGGTSDYMGKMEFVGSGTNGFATDIVFSSKTGDFFNSTTEEHLRIDSNGNVGIGTDSPTEALRVGSTSSSYIGIGGGGTSASGIRFYRGASTVDGLIEVDSAENLVLSIDDTGTLGASNMLFNIGNDEKMRIDSSGNLLVGRDTPGGGSEAGHTLFGTGAIYSSLDGTATVNQYRFYRNGSLVGSINTSGSGTAYVTTSDVRLKDNIVDAPAGNIDSIKVRSFDWKADGSHQEYGFVAQELDEVAPYAVSKGEGPNDMWGVDYSKLVPMLVKEIQDLKAEVAALKGAN